MDLGDPNLKVDIAPDDKTKLNKGVSCGLEEFEVCFDHHSGGRLIPQRNQRIELKKQAEPSTGGHVATPYEHDDDIEQGTPSAAKVGDSMEVEEELNIHGNEWP